LAADITLPTLPGRVEADERAQLSHPLLKLIITKMQNEDILIYVKCTPLSY
jgi:hypothetical protein